MSDESRVYQRLNTLKFYATHIHPCSYLPQREAVTLFVDPAAAMDSQTYSALARLGFRRSGEHLYRPHCPRCQACIPVRIPVCDFQPDRGQQRTWRRNRDVNVTPHEMAFNEEHYALYREYLQQRHPGGGMDAGDEDDYLRFVTSPWSDTRLYEFRAGQRLLAVAVVDHLPDALSAVYTFYSPTEARRGLGVQAVLWQVAEAARRGLSWVYLGYWIKESPKMAYKDRYHPLEYFDGQGWRRLDARRTT